MKVSELLNSTLTEEQLEELNIKHAIAIGAIAASAAMPVNKLEPTRSISLPGIQHVVKDDIEEMVSVVLDKYIISREEATKIVKFAVKYEDRVFPKARDILAIIGIESSFNPNAISKLKKDPALGLTQIRPAKWGIKPYELKGDIEKQIKLSAEILAKYHGKLNNVDDTVHAYNVGITNFKKGKHNPQYVQKFTKERNRYA